MLAARTSGVRGAPQSLAKARPRESRGGSATGTCSVLGRQHVHTQLSPHALSYCLKGVTHSHLKILEGCQDTGPIEALLLYVMQLEDKGGGSWGLATALSQ